MATNDSRGYALIGDPAVRLSLAAAGAKPKRAALGKLQARTGGLPVVLALDSVPPEELPAVEQEIAGQGGSQSFAAGGAPSGLESPSGGKPPQGGGGEPSQGGAGGQTPPVQSVVKTEKPAPVTSAASAVPFASPMDGLAFALQTYTGEGQVSFSMSGEADVSFGIVDDAKNMVKDVVVNLNTALQNLSKRLLEATNEALTLEVTTSLVENLDNFDPQKPGDQQPAARFKTTISATGDVQAYLPNRPGAVDDVLLQVHKDMVEQALLNRMETVKAIGELVASLFNPAK
jgi:hypothetical protein